MSFKKKTNIFLFNLQNNMIIINSFQSIIIFTRFVQSNMPLYFAKTITSINQVKSPLIWHSITWGQFIASRHLTPYREQVQTYFNDSFIRNNNNLGGSMAPIELRILLFINRMFVLIWRKNFFFRESVLFMGSKRLLSHSSIVRKMDGLLINCM